MESVYCVNCGSAGGSMMLEDEQILQCIQQWTAPLLVQSHDLICITCWTVAVAHEMINTLTSNGGSNCAMCNRTLAPRTRSHQLISLRTDTQHHLNIRSIIIERLMPLEILSSHYICHPCWQKCDRAARHYSTPSSSRFTPTTNNQSRCANCGIHFNRLRRHILNNDAILVQIQQRVAPQIVTSNDYVCDACHTLFVDRDPTMLQDVNAPMVGHQHICVMCGCSVARIRSYTVGIESNSNILDAVQQLIQPREVQSSNLLCHRCFQRANTTAISNILSKSVVNPIPQQIERITLPNYFRASATHNRCIFLRCNSTSQKVVPLVLRARLFRDHNYYIPPDCRICELHLARQSWSELFNAENVNQSFTAAHIEDFCELLKNENNTGCLEDRCKAVKQS